MSCASGAHCKLIDFSLSSNANQRVQSTGEEEEEEEEEKADRAGAGSCEIKEGNARNFAQNLITDSAAQPN